MPSLPYTATRAVWQQYSILPLSSVVNVSLMQIDRRHKCENSFQTGWYSNPVSEIPLFMIMLVSTYEIRIYLT